MNADPDLVAQALPAYELGEELGRGAWGVVVAGRHRSLGRDVAIKQLPRAFGADPDVHARFITEARLLASLDHPHIVPIYDFVEHGDLCLLIMERLTGGTVWSRFRDDGFTDRAACAIALAACAALQYAHQHGVLHRDIKPENLMFSGEGVLKVTDFGIAKVVGGSATMGTRAGAVLGTPAYIAPEQALSGELSPASDVYALGTVLYELLAGRLPYPVTSNPVTVLYQHVHEEHRPLDDVAPNVPASIVAVVARALQRDPADRYASAEDYGVDLAAAAVDAWGSQWSSRSGITLRGADAIVTRAQDAAQTSPPTTPVPLETPPAIRALADHSPAATPAQELQPSELVPLADLVQDSAPTLAPHAPIARPAEPPRPEPPRSEPPPPGAQRHKRWPLIVAIAAVLAVAGVVLAIALGRGGGGNGGRASSSSSSSSSSSDGVAPPEHELEVPGAIGDFKLEPSNPPTTGLSLFDAKGTYIRTSDQTALILNVQRVIGALVPGQRITPAARATRRANLNRLADSTFTAMKRVLFAPGALETTVTTGATPYRCMTGRTTIEPPANVTGCVWTENFLVFQLHVVPERNLQDVVRLAALAQEGTKR